MQGGGGGLGQLAGGVAELGDVQNSDGELHNLHGREASTASSGVVPVQEKDVRECGGAAESRN